MELIIVSDMMLADKIHSRQSRESARVHTSEREESPRDTRTLESALRLLQERKRERERERDEGGPRDGVWLRIGMTNGKALQRSST
jgi:hypothetical protein